MTEYADTINERLMLDRIAELRAKVSDADKVISGLAQALTAGQVQYAELEAQLAEARKAAEWTLIDAEHLPQVGDEVGGYDLALAIPSWRIRLVSVAFLANLDIPQWRRYGYTHYRPKNASQEPA